MWTLEGDKVVRNRRACPKCGSAVFMAEHFDRFHCGQCGNTLFKRQGQPAQAAQDDRLQQRRRKE
jgi:small subunit ribosomal protein S27Ae